MLWTIKSKLNSFLLNESQKCKLIKSICLTILTTWFLRRVFVLFGVSVIQMSVATDKTMISLWLMYLYGTLFNYANYINLFRLQSVPSEGISTHDYINEQVFTTLIVITLFILIKIF